VLSTALTSSIEDDISARRRPLGGEGDYIQTIPCPQNTCADPSKEYPRVQTFQVGIQAALGSLNPNNCHILDRCLNDTADHCEN
jgi:hypothetical protein